MEITIKTTDEDRIRLLLGGPAYYAFMTEFWEWLSGPGRESSAGEISAKYQDFAATHHIYFS